jgi:hypothetical protein
MTTPQPFDCDRLDEAIAAAAEHRYRYNAGFRATVEHTVHGILAQQDDMNDGADDVRRRVTLDTYLTWCANPLPPPGQVDDR